MKTVSITSKAGLYFFGAELCQDRIEAIQKALNKGADMIRVNYEAKQVAYGRTLAERLVAREN